jgi:hypothetical protein
LASLRNPKTAAATQPAVGGQEAHFGLLFMSKTAILLHEEGKFDDVGRRRLTPIDARVESAWFQPLKLETD